MGQQEVVGQIVHKLLQGDLHEKMVPQVLDTDVDQLQRQSHQIGVHVDHGQPLFQSSHRLLGRDLLRADLIGDVVGDADLDGPIGDQFQRRLRDKVVELDVQRQSKPRHLGRNWRGKRMGVAVVVANRRLRTLWRPVLQVVETELDKNKTPISQITDYN